MKSLRATDDTITVNVPASRAYNQWTQPTTVPSANLSTSVAPRRPGSHPVTRRSIAFSLAKNDHPDTPWGVLTGDSLFVSSAGRPDLLGNAQAKKLAEQQSHTLRDLCVKLTAVACPISSSTACQQVPTSISQL